MEPVNKERESDCNVKSGYTEQSDKIREKNRIRYHTVRHIEILSVMKMRSKEIRWKKKSI